MNSIIAIGDVHGCYNTLMALVDKLPKNAPVVMLGDLVDRGPRNRDVINWVRKNNIPCVVGNHEILMATRDYSEKQIWMMNGGAATQREYRTKPLIDAHMSHYLKGYQELAIDEEAYESDTNWMNSLPWYLEFKDVKNKDGRHLVLSHTTIASYWEKRSTANAFDVVWDRKSIPKSIPGIYNVYGHTPTKKPLIREHFANIDTGCVYGSSYNLGNLTALQFPEMTIYQQKCIDFDLD
jgi:serine/threonine protein phosphatase 1